MDDGERNRRAAISLSFSTSCFRARMARVLPLLQAAKATAEDSDCDGEGCTANDTAALLQQVLKLLAAFQRDYEHFAEVER